MTELELKCLAGWLEKSLDAARAEERARIVAWLRERAGNRLGHDVDLLRDSADALARGERP